MGEWMNPEEFTAVFRLTTVKYANEFIDKGIIKFSTPQSWVDYYKKHGDGRGDAYEGTIAFCGLSDTERIIELKREYESPILLNEEIRPIITNAFKNRLLFKDKRSLQLPCFCFYIMKNSLFDAPDSAGKHRASADIPAAYFRDFADNALPADVEKLPVEDQPALIVISNFEEFKARLYKALNGLGVEENEILIGRVHYEDFEKYGPNGWDDFRQKYPKELLVKNMSFKDQSEARVIINTRRPDIIKRLCDNVLELGNMSDIAQVSNSYLYEGIRVEATLDVYEK